MVWDLEPKYSGVSPSLNTGLQVSGLQGLPAMCGAHSFWAGHDFGVAMKGQLMQQQWRPASAHERLRADVSEEWFPEMKGKHRTALCQDQICVLVVIYL